MKTMPLAVLALLLGLGVGFGATWVEFLRGTDYFKPEGMDVKQRWPRRDGDLSKMQPLPNESETGQPKVLVVNGESYDFGSMDVNTKMSHTFVIKNVGTAPLKLEQGRTTCKCTVSQLESDTVPPGESVRVTLEWTPKKYEEVFTQTAEFRTSDPDRPLIFLEVTGKIVKSIRAVPSSVVFSDISPNEASVAAVDVLAFKHDHMTCKKWELTNPETADLFAVDVRPLTDEQLAEHLGARSGFRLVVTAKQGMPVGPIQQGLEVLTSLHTDKGLQIPIRGDVVGDVMFRAQPNLDVEHHLLNLGLIKKGTALKTTIHVLVRGPHRRDVQLSVDPADIDPADVLKVSLGKPLAIANGRAYMHPVTITVPAGSRPVERFGPKAENYGKLILRTTHPTEKKIQLYISFAVEG